MLNTNPVQALVEKLVELGCNAALAATMVADAMSTRQQGDEAAEKRRAWDREYRRRRRQNPPDIHPNPPDIHPTQVDALSIYIDKPMYVEEKELPVKIKKVSKKKLIDLPENWRPPDRSLALAKANGLEVPEMEDRWRDYLKSSGKLYADHDAAFCNFLRNEPKFNPKNHLSAKPIQPPRRRTIHDQADELLAAAATIQNQPGSGCKLVGGPDKIIPADFGYVTRKNEGNGGDIYPISGKRIEADLQSSDGDSYQF